MTETINQLIVKLTGNYIDTKSFLEDGFIALIKAIKVLIRTALNFNYLNIHIVGSTDGR